MVRVAGLMKNMRLSEVDSKGVKLRVSAKEKGKGAEPQAVEKILSEKPAHPEAVALVLGKAWCPIKGIDCKELADIFLFTFKQESGKGKALEDGPWISWRSTSRAGGLRKYEFKDVPIWVRVYRLPPGMMNESGEQIGEMLGQFVEMGMGLNGQAVGKVPPD